MDLRVVKKRLQDGEAIRELYPTRLPAAALIDARRAGLISTKEAVAIIEARAFDRRLRQFGVWKVIE